MIRRLLREPLLHFLLIGAVLFLLYGLVSGGRPDPGREIVIPAARVEALAERFAAVWMRPPTAVELKGLIDDYVADEIYYREAMALGLHEDDDVIRRRLRQKMELIAEGIADSLEPTDAQLQRYLEENAGRFTQPPQFTFRQVYLSPERRGDRVRADALQLLAGLQGGSGPADPLEAGDPTLLPATMAGASPQAIASAFGEDFARQVDEAPVGQWTGPVESTFGLHIVRVDERVAGKTPTLGEVRPDVLREWQAGERQRQNAARLSALRGNYEVRVEGPAASLFAGPGDGGAVR